MPTSISPDGDISRLHPEVRAKVTAILKELHKQDIPFEVFEAMRTPQRQAHLYAKGRTTSGNKVTWVQPWGSIHQYGLAVDFVLKINGKWSWDDKGAEAAYWPKMHEIAKKHGMTPLYNKSGRLIEMPHVQLVGVSATSLRQGNYPAGGDAAWADHMAAMIDGWNGATPPKPDLAPDLPAIDDDLMAELEAETPQATPAAGPLSSAEADAKFQKLHSFVVWAEGGFVSHPEDNDGGATNFGITLKTLSDWRGRPVTVDEVRNLSKEEAQSILRANYYTRCRCGEMPDRIAMVVYNTSVLSGPNRAIRTLQSAFNELGLTLSGKSLVVDGIMGSNTMAAAKQTDATVLADKYLDLYEVYLRGLANFPTFGNGWLNRLAKLREFLTTMPSGAGARPTEAMRIEEEVVVPEAGLDLGIDVDLDGKDVLGAALAGATGGKSALVRLLLARVLERRGASTAQMALASVLSGEKVDVVELVKAIDDEPDAAPVPAGEKELTPINGALGPMIGRLLDGKKSVLGIIGVLAAGVLPELGILSKETIDIIFGSGSVATGGTETGVDRQSAFLTIASLLTGWGFLGKIDKMVKDPDAKV